MSTKITNSIYLYTYQHALYRSPSFLHMPKNKEEGRFPMSAQKAECPIGDGDLWSPSHMPLKKKWRWGGAGVFDLL